MSHSHHNHLHSHDQKGQNLLIAIVLNIAITVLQVIGGIISGSLALLSDALHNFTHVISLMVSYIATVLSKKSASLHKTFGYKRAEILAAFVNAATLIIVAVILIKEAFDKNKIVIPFPIRTLDFGIKGGERLSDSLRVNKVLSIISNEK